MSILSLKEMLYGMIWPRDDHDGQQGCRHNQPSSHFSTVILPNQTTGPRKPHTSADLQKISSEGGLFLHLSADPPTLRISDEPHLGRKNMKPTSC